MATVERGLRRFEFVSFVARELTMEVRDLIDRCSQNDPEAWAGLWEIVSSAALYPIRRLLQHQGIGLELADDVMQEFYMYLLQKDMEPLRAFVGESMPQFRVYLRTLAVHFTLNAMRKFMRVRRQDEKAALGAPLPDRTGPTEQQIELTMRELESLMSDKDRSRLARLLCIESLPEANDSEVDPLNTRSGRTIRRWQEELYRRYGRRVI
jgi:DNA-directed RNA polymerase specialized sigma24 family protein